MMCEGSAFKRVMRIPPGKLKVSSFDGVKALVEALGGLWGKTVLEDKFEKFERAIFSTTQRSDETNESYLARHDYLFEELISLKVTLTEIRAYILLRNSGLAPEDKKKLIVDSKGTLDYQAVVDSLKLLGSRFFHEVQGGNKNPNRTKTYDTQVAVEEEAHLMSTGGAVEEDNGIPWELDDGAIEALAEEGDPDAFVCIQFEEAIIDVLQSDPDTASCLTSYTEARQRLTDRNKSRGFWAPKPGKGKKGRGKGKFSGKGRKPLSVRIMESACRRCGQMGHWKAECPLKQNSNVNSSEKTPAAFAGTITVLEEDEASDDMILLEVANEVPLNDSENNQIVSTSRFFGKQHSSDDSVNDIIVSKSPVLGNPQETFCLMKKTKGEGNSAKNVSVFKNFAQRLIPSLKTRLTPENSPQPSKPKFSPPTLQVQEACFASTGSFGIVDLGASQTVVGKQQIDHVISSLPEVVQNQIKEIPCNTIFRFGNSSTVHCQKAKLIPLGRWWIKLCVVSSETPFLLSNNVFRTLGAQIDTEADEVHFKKLGFSMPLTLSKRKLYLLDFADLVTRTWKCRQSQIDANFSVQEIKIDDVMLVRDNLGTNPPQQSDSKSSHVSQETGSERSCRSLSSTPCRTSHSRELHGDDDARARDECHPIRRSEAGHDFQGSGDERSELRDLVHHSICQQSKGKPSQISALCQDVCREKGDGEVSLNASSEAEGNDSGELRLGRHGCSMLLGSGARSRATGSIATAECSDRTTGIHAEPDRRTAANPDRADRESRTESDARKSQSASDVESKSLPDVPFEKILDEEQFGIANLQDSEALVLDSEFFFDQGLENIHGPNRISVEMFRYWHQKHGMTSNQIHRHFERSYAHVLEVYCSEGSQLTHQAQASGLKAFRFGLRQGDLATFDGRCKLYDVLWAIKPLHIWVSPKCGPWSKWNQLNVCKSEKLANQIHQERKSENVHLLLCDALFRFQSWRSPATHFHLEQPQGSELIFQKEMQAILKHTLRALCDMCVAGNLRHPDNSELLRKRTQVLTTSPIMCRMLEQAQCTGTHGHAVIQGSCKPLGQPRIPLTRYTELYTAKFGKKLSQTILCSATVKENRWLSPEYLSAEETNPVLAADIAETTESAQKRRRLDQKSPASALLIPTATEIWKENCLKVLQEVEKITPRVGKIVLQHGPIFDEIQKMFEDVSVQVIDVCRGIDRKRSPPIQLHPGTAPLRRAFGKRRSDLTLFVEDDWEPWEKLSKRKLIRKGEPSRILVTMFARPKAVSRENTPKRTSEEAENPQQPAKALRIEANPQNESEPKIPDQLDAEPEISTSEKSSPKPKHGPMFRALPSGLQNQIIKIHKNLGHPNLEQLQKAFERSGWSETVTQAIRDFVCDTCFERQLPKIPRPGHLHKIREFNEMVSFDVADWQGSNGQRHMFVHFIDSATNFQIAVPVHQRTSEAMIDHFNQAWIRWAGPPKEIMCDSAGEFNSETFAKFLQDQSIAAHVIPAEAHWQLGRAERHGSILKEMLSKYHEDKPIRSDQEFEQALIELCSAKNAMSRHAGYTPEILVLGKMRKLPGSNSQEFDSASYSGCDEETSEGIRFQENMSRREAARLAFVKADHSLALRKALHARSRPDRLKFQAGDWVMYWRNGRGLEPGYWNGPAKVLTVETPNIIWISHMTKLFRCAPEHVRSLSSREAQNNESHDKSSPLPEQLGTGVFQYQHLRNPERATNQLPTIPEQEVVIRNDNAPASSSANQNVDWSRNVSFEGPIAPSVSQPDTEPEIENVENPNLTEQTTPVDASQIPLPVDEQDDLNTETLRPETGFWEIQDVFLIRHHVQPRLQKFFPFQSSSIPVPLENLAETRFTLGKLANGEYFQEHETWKDNVAAHTLKSDAWTGKTCFLMINKPESVKPILHEIEEPQTCLSLEILLDETEIQQCMKKNMEQQESFLASTAKKQRAEVKIQDLTQEEKLLFQKAKDTEIDSWLSTETVRRIARNSIPQGQLLRTRWVLVWKNLDEEDQRKLGMSRKPKARLVILGFEDPHIDTLERDSPTLGRDSRMVALQTIASMRWKVRSFDIRTAFLRGRRQDNRILGVEPPPEMRSKMKLKENETCELLRGAYGLINAPLLWYCELKTALQGLGFVMAPFDPCLFLLPKRNLPEYKDSNKNTSGDPAIHGILGIHVDDGIGGGDSVFEAAINKLETLFPFGSKRERSFVFTGLQLDQEINGDITLNQKDYINDIPTIDVARERRKDTKQQVSSQELQSLRGLIGSLQYAATNTRPDISCKLSLLQAKISSATVQDLLNANRILEEAKRNNDVQIKIKAIDPKDVRFLSFSDAAFATREKANSQKGCLIVATSKQINQFESATVSPLVWSSKKINRVVASTLASETYALSGALDQLSWIRMLWAWIVDPKVKWQNPEETLSKLPEAYAVVDCKSLFDLLQKTSIPQCSEYRTMLEALVIRDRLREGVVVKWVHSAAQMADALTKDMDTSTLREFLKQGRCVIHDVEEILKQRSDKRLRQEWYRRSTSGNETYHEKCHLCTSRSIMSLNT